VVFTVFSLFQTLAIQEVGSPPRSHTHGMPDLAVANAGSRWVTRVCVARRGYCVVRRRLRGDQRSLSLSNAGIAATDAGPGLAGETQSIPALLSPKGATASSQSQGRKPLEQREKEGEAPKGRRQVQPFRRPFGASRFGGISLPGACAPGYTLPPLRGW
jgi:hypothetical protein